MKLDNSLTQYSALIFELSRQFDPNLTPVQSPSFRVVPQGEETTSQF